MRPHMPVTTNTPTRWISETPLGLDVQEKREIKLGNMRTGQLEVVANRIHPK